IVQWACQKGSRRNDVMHVAVRCVVYSLLAGSRWASSRLSVFVPPRAASAADQAMIAVPSARSAVLAGGTDALSQPFLPTHASVTDPAHRTATAHQQQDAVARP